MRVRTPILALVADSGSALLNAALAHAAEVERAQVVLVLKEPKPEPSREQVLPQSLEALGAALAAKLHTPEPDPAPVAAYSMMLSAARPGEARPRYPGVMAFLQRYPNEFG